MKLDRLAYQIEAIGCVISAIDIGDVTIDNNFFANPLLRASRNIDVKMETGTGKTYVYTRLLHELKRCFGFFKFIILVPGIAVKENVRLSIISDTWNKHFRQEFMNQCIELNTINAGDFDTKKSKSKRKQIPENLRSFCNASRSEDKTINALLLNDAMLASVSMSRRDYDSTLLGNVSCPLDGLKFVRPIVILDEPHRFKKDGKAWQNIVENICPQLIIRFGATFPDKEIGSGINKKKEKDYENLVYDLNAVNAFNRGLVKGVHIQYPALDDPNTKKYKITKIKKGKNITINNTELKIGDKLSIIDAAFGGALTLEYEKNYPTQLKLSNELAVDVGLELSPHIFSNDYQSLLLTQALNAHFDKEKENFYRKNTQNNGINLPKIKTISLFFIDSIASFRGNDSEAKGWLRAKFEELLKQKLKIEIANNNGSYREFLEYSLRNIDATIAGYFAEDNTRKNDEVIQKEISDILRNKESMLQFRNTDGSWNLRRFLFSKWTLREGWDNPNIFVITKLRSSGSEISKIQEVGRGLRLPFDENGTRVTPTANGEDFRLTYIIDYSEREFAKKLVGEINMDDNNKKLNKGKITSEEISVRKNFDNKKHKNIESKTNKNETIENQVLRFEKLDDNGIGKLLEKILAGKKIFVKPSMQIVNEFIGHNNKHITLTTNNRSNLETTLGIVSYGEFLKRLNQHTSIPLTILHANIIKADKRKKLTNDLFNTTTINNIIEAFENNL
ncbi:MAG: type III restriction-modification system endonuclease [Planctomycetaceae bacterium]|jgi:type III restriction enzyme|nr:type III restriction-modification system endonuclease [Planctomycetaceae bacterium]